MPEKVDWEYLLKKFTTNTCTREEFNQLLDLIDKDDYDELTDELRKYWMKEPTEDLPKVDWNEKLSTLLVNANNDPASPAVKKYFHIGPIAKWTAAAAVVLIAWGTITWFQRHHSLPAFDSLAQLRQHEPVLKPGRSKATLMLANGTVIGLDSAQNGMVAKEGDIKIFKGEDGELLYFPDRQNTNPTTAYNTVSTPLGGKYSIVLSDGTKVWLNSGSSLRYPASFNGSCRKVTLTGEGYFEVTKDAHSPFLVTANQTEVEVLGTHFNVNAYRDENEVSTTLLEGAVKVMVDENNNAGHRCAKLKPGEQANVTRDNRIQLNHHANLTEAVAWKNDFFEFDNVSIPIIMRQLARWYDVKIEYRNSMPENKLTGKFSRNIPLNQVINMLKYTGVNMKIENRVLIISNH